MKQKHLYTAPEAETLVVRFESALLNVSTKGNTINNGTIEEWDGEL